MADIVDDIVAMAGQTDTHSPSRRAASSRTRVRPARWLRWGPEEDEDDGESSPQRRESPTALPATNILTPMRLPLYMRVKR